MTKETAMKILKELHSKSLFAERTALETLIPELKESEDERIKKRILLSLEKDLMATKNSGCDTQDLEQCIAWLEKQGKQKPVLDFKASNWYVSKVDGKIHDMTYNSTDKVEPKFKIGDVLCDKSCTTLNKNSQPNIEVRDIRNGLYICNNCVFPIEQQDEYELITKRIEPQSAWSEEDELIVESIEGALEGYESLVSEGWEKEKEWLKSLKDRAIWKPSEEQIHAFIQVYVWYSNNFAPSAALTSLYNDLKKL